MSLILNRIAVRNDIILNWKFNFRKPNGIGPCRLSPVNENNAVLRVGLHQDPISDAFSLNENLIEKGLLPRRRTLIVSLRIHSGVDGTSCLAATSYRTQLFYYWTKSKWPVQVCMQVLTIQFQSLNGKTSSRTDVRSPWKTLHESLNASSNFSFFAGRTRSNNGTWKPRIGLISSTHFLASVNHWRWVLKPPSAGQQVQQ